MLNQVQIMGKIISMPVETVNTKKEYIFKIKVEKNFKDEEFDIFDVAIWKGKYLQMKSFDDLVNQYVIVKGRLELLNLKYHETDEMKSSFVIVCEDLEYLSKYS